MWGRVTTVQGGVQLNYDLNEASESERDDESSTQSLSLGVPCYDTGAGENQLLCRAHDARAARRADHA